MIALLKVQEVLSDVSRITKKAKNTSNKYHRPLQWEDKPNKKLARLF